MENTAAEPAGPRRRSARGRRQGFLRLSVWLFLAVVVFSPTINILTAESWYLRPVAIGVMSLCALMFMYYYTITNAGTWFAILSVTLAALSAVSSLVVGVMEISPSKVIGLTFVLLITPTIFDAHRDVLYRFSRAALAIHLTFVVLQFLGVTAFAYSFVTYANEAAPVDLINRASYFGERIVVPFLPQLRPSGWFPSPTYVAVFCVFLWSQLVATTEFDHRRVLFGIGAFFILLGSTVGVFLVAVSVLYVGYKRSIVWLIMGAALTLVLYATLAPYQYSYNFNFGDIVDSFVSRLDPWSKGESILQQNPAALVAGVLALVGALLMARRIKLLLTFKIVVTLGLPVMTHDVSGSLLYWLIVALTGAAVLPIRFLTPKRRRRQSSTATAPPIPATT